MNVTIEQAARRYVDRYTEWQMAVKAHKNLLQSTVCTSAEADLKRGDLEGRARRCFERPDRHPHFDLCDGCKETLKWYEERVRAARRSGAALRVLVQTVKRAGDDAP